MKPSPLFICDDFGMHPSSDQAIIELAQVGAISGTSVMVTESSQYHDYQLPETLQVGLHLNLTENQSLSSLFSGIYLGKIKKSDLKQEIKKQIQTFYSHYGRMDHIDGHQHVQYLPQINDCIQEVIAELKIKPPRIRLGKPVGFSVNVRGLGLWILSQFHLQRQHAYLTPISHSRLMDYDTIDPAALADQQGVEVMMHVAHPENDASDLDPSSYNYKMRCQQYTQQMAQRRGN